MSARRVLRFWKDDIFGSGFFSHQGMKTRKTAVGLGGLKDSGWRDFCQRKREESTAKCFMRA